MSEEDEWRDIIKLGTMLHMEESRQVCLRNEERKQKIKQELDK
jgi:hypothetical protein